MAVLILLIYFLFIQRQVIQTNELTLGSYKQNRETY